ncbi:Hsp20/alpha crystallin family protein [Oculatella sp. LEGE 06141]|uniref:Hsp20/alpha crystallin family protein n=1 Tax=Oculatella sp. LEGE 06141 TaxID=1828648 RepID=UPI001880C56F|nr:Hsp20/alpha crystallin family protein [Oculatella sp. LEGE 06141]MBE9177191.1 Hsp20/alpha crystallin family protein [Oculatella sp. LEGE 06141]
MAIMRWDPFREMDILRRQMNRLFYDLEATNRDSSDVTQGIDTAWVPAVELQDTGSELILRAEVPGIDAKNLDVQVMRDAVAIAGEHRSEKRTESEGHFRSEFRYGSFRRVIPLPMQVQNDQVKADLKDGILTLALPKVEAERNRVFKVSLTGTQPEAIEAEQSTNG